VTLGHRTLNGRVEIVSDIPAGVEIVDGPTAVLEVGRRATIMGRESGT
jgi:hypothetical protein